LKIVVLTGAGISAESGISTFRDTEGLWESNNIEEVASPNGWAENPDLVNNFYNQRRAQLQTVEPNLSHIALVELAKKHDVHIITQNVDDLHERAGSQNILHLHGELLKVRDEVTGEVYYHPGDLDYTELSPNGNTLRPHIVWFYEMVPLITDAQQLVAQAEHLIIIGTSLQIYPAAGLIDYAPTGCPVTVIDTIDPAAQYEYTFINGPASSRVPAFVQTLI
jgi:NAD-dependent deacetylase